ncbi:MAG: hypothetical protein ACJ798_17090 [Phenylobacterium sp.]
MTQRSAFAACWLAAVVVAAFAAGPADAASPPAAKPYHAPRTAYGAPDLQGIWTNSALTFLARPPIFKGLIATDAEEKMMLKGFMSLVGDLIKPTVDPNEGAPPVVKEAPQSDILEMDLHLGRIDGQPRSSWIVEPANGQIPFTDAGRKAYAGRRSTLNDPEARPLTERCMIAIGSPEGPPMMNTGFNANYRIVQAKDFVAIQVEMNHDVRIVRMVDRTHAPAPVTRWMGDSVGWWDGDTLVVETTNLDPRAAVDSLNGGFRNGPKTRIIERFTRTAKDAILYEFTVQDADYYKQPWSGQMPMRTAKGPIYEYACHEGNYSIANALSGARAEEKLAANAAPSAGPPTAK